MKKFLILLIFFILNINYGFTYYFTVDEYQYYVSCTMKKNWHMASKFCADNEMFLIDIPNLQEEVRIMSLVLRPGNKF